MQQLLAGFGVTPEDIKAVLEARELIAVALCRGAIANGPCHFPGSVEETCQQPVCISPPVQAHDLDSNGQLDWTEFQAFMSKQTGSLQVGRADLLMRMQCTGLCWLGCRHMQHVRMGAILSCDATTAKELRHRAAYILGANSAWRRRWCGGGYPVMRSAAAAQGCRQMWRRRRKGKSGGAPTSEGRLDWLACVYAM